MPGMMQRNSRTTASQKFGRFCTVTDPPSMRSDTTVACAPKDARDASTASLASCSARCVVTPKDVSDPASVVIDAPHDRQTGVGGRDAVAPHAPQNARYGPALIGSCLLGYHLRYFNDGL